MLFEALLMLHCVSRLCLPLGLGNGVFCKPALRC